MARGFPSMTALLGLLAVAGYQNRDRIADMLRGSGLGSGAGLGGATGSGGLIGGGIGELLERFRDAGHGDKAESWIGTGPNREMTPGELEHSLGEDMIGELTRKTGLTRAELLQRLSRELPTAVDRYTPEGRIPQD